MSVQNVATRVGACLLPFALAACGSFGGRTAGLPNQEIRNVAEMSQPAVVRDPCNSVGIEAIPQTQETVEDRRYNASRGYRRSFHNGFVIYSKESLTTTFGPLVGGIVGGVAGASIGGGSGAAVLGTIGATAGALTGEFLGGMSREQYLVNLAGCRAYLNSTGPAPLREFITGAPADRPHGARARVFDDNSRFVEKIAPYSDTSPGGRRYVP